VTLPSLYVILDVEVAAAHGWAVPDLARACLAGGARLFQLRAKQLPSSRFLALLDELVALTKASDAILIANDRADLARMAGASGVHVGQDDLPAAAARAVVGPAGIVGLSTHTRTQVADAVVQRIDYLAVGPIYATSSKDTGYEPVGTKLVAFAAEAGRGRADGPLPVVAIGGITLERAAEVRAAGAASVAIISDLFVGGDPAARIRALLERLAAGPF
jgi:thiamine-phosphate pyrophosphorylase